MPVLLWVEVCDTLRVLLNVGVDDVRPVSSGGVGDRGHDLDVDLVPLSVGAGELGSAFPESEKRGNGAFLVAA